MDTKMNTGKETKKMVKNEMDLRFDARSENEAFARVAVAAFVSALNPTLEEISDIKTAVSEAVTNAIIHGYEIYGQLRNWNHHWQIQENLLFWREGVRD